MKEIPALCPRPNEEVSVDEITGGYGLAALLQEAFLQAETDDGLERMDIWQPAGSIRCLLISIAPVLLGRKPAELLNIGLPPTIWENFIQSLTQETNIECCDIRSINARRQVIFYNRDVLSQRLFDPVGQAFLRKLNYPAFPTFEDYLAFLIEKIRFLDFPHEIGLFLGYPLKDVLGFMGLAPLPYVKTQGWRVYGEPLLSDEWYKTYQAARRGIKKVLRDGFRLSKGS